MNRMHARGGREEPSIGSHRKTQTRRGDDAGRVATERRDHHVAATRPAPAGPTSAETARSAIRVTPLISSKRHTGRRTADTSSPISAYDKPPAIASRPP